MCHHQHNLNDLAAILHLSGLAGGWGDGVLDIADEGLYCVGRGGRNPSIHKGEREGVHTQGGL